MTADVERGVETVVYGDYADLLKPDTKWAIGGFPGWEFREPNAVVLVQNGKLRVAAVPLTRTHDFVQFFDNAHHMYFSKETFAVPPGGSISFELDLRCEKVNGVPDDFYDGYVSFNLLDLSQGLAIDFFQSNERYATVYARLPFPGAAAPEGEGQRYFGLFNERPLPKGERQTHRYRITYDQAAAELLFYVEGELVNRESDVPRMESMIAALGIMTEKDIQDGKSVSCHGQGVIAEYGPLTITRRFA
ncbi:MAG TPA: DUF6081 family protein [Dehalococcoidia bacterium]|nr:DUF6081 family protein [Dehalococcoidia bacterium]